MDSYKTVIVVGAGIFGISTALALAKRYPDVKIQVIDRFEPPVPDATSVDTTRCIRVDYKSDVYYKLACESLQKIIEDPIISQFFHQSGMSFTYNGEHDRWEDIFLTGKKSAEDANKGHMERFSYFDSPEDVYKSIHGNTSKPRCEKCLGRNTWWNKGYRNLANGFIDAELSMKAYYDRAKSFPNIKFTFEEVKKLVYYPNSNEFESVLLQNGEQVFGNLVIIAAGAWSGKLVNLKGMCEMSAIEVGWIKVTPKETEKWKNMSITTNLSTGINLFPPYNGEVKVLRRSPGYKNTVYVDNPNPKEKTSIEISYPRTLITNPSDWMPLDAEEVIRENLREIMPSLADRPFDRTKLCWLTQTPTANFLIDYHPACKNVLLATGGSAHAWKFVPIIGDKVVDFIEGNLEPTLAKMWAWKEKLGETVDNGSAPRMQGKPQELREVIKRQYTEKSYL